jgi:hypothetical protein
LDFERFAVYGFSIAYPNDWRFEFDPKSARGKGNAVFHSPGRNKFFVSWGPLKDAEKRFPSLRDQAEGSVKRLKKGKDVKKIDARTMDTVISEHEAVLSDVNAEVMAGGFLSRNVFQRHLWSCHLRCPQSERYFVLYSNHQNPQEYTNFEAIVAAIENSFRCHLASEVIPVEQEAESI